jgi:site-specific recombinase XerD
LEDFFFLRSIINGLDVAKSYERYYGHMYSDAQGRIAIPHASTLLAKAKSLIDSIVTQSTGHSNNDVKSVAVKLQAPLPKVSAKPAAQEMATLGFDEWAETVPDMYPENEMPERYQDYLNGLEALPSEEESTAVKELVNRSNAIHAKVRALNALQTELARRPIPEHSVTLWFTLHLSDALASESIYNLLSLVRFISSEGRNWYKRLPAIGQARARRIEQWVDFHSDTLPRIDRQNAMWNRHRQTSKRANGLLKETYTVVLDAHTGQVLPSTPRKWPAPLEDLVAPQRLDGSNGTFRSPNANQFGATNDLQAIKSYLSSFVAAGKKKAFEAYRREIERFYLWCLYSGIPLSSATLAHAQAYQLFLKKIPVQWINPRPVERTSALWKPFRGQLDPKSQNYALGVLKQFFRKLIENGYLTSSPFASIQKTAAVSTGFSIDTTRAFSSSEMDLIKSVLSKLPGIKSCDPLVAAKARRMQLIIEIMLTTGMRRNEVCTSSLKNMSAVRPTGLTEDVFTLRIVGKGEKARLVTLSSKTVARILQHHDDFRTLRANNPAIVEDLERTLPLILALEPPISSGESAPRSALSSSGLYRLVKGFFRHVLKSAKYTGEAESFTQATPHWTRHTFAHAVLDSNFKGKGLPLAQRLLGHASLSTTGQYTEQDSSELILASRLAALL